MVSPNQPKVPEMFTYDWKVVLHDTPMISMDSMHPASYMGGHLLDAISFKTKTAITLDVHEIWSLCIGKRGFVLNGACE